MQKVFKFILAFVFIVSFFSCKREDTEIGLDLQNPSDMLDVILHRETNIVSYTFLEDSLYTNTYGGVLGSYKDNVFGKTQANIYTQITLNANNLNLSSFQLDSVMLDFKVTGVYPSARQNYPKKVYLEVYQLSEKIEEERSYYAMDSIPYTSSDLLFGGEITLDGGSSDSTGKQNVSIRLNDLFRDSFKDDFSSNSTFVEKMRGICLRIDESRSEGDGTMMYINLADTISGVKLHYHDENDSAQVYHFSLGSKSRKFSQFKNDFSGTPLNTISINPMDSIVGNPELYLQDLSGLAVGLQFPSLLEWGIQHPKAIINEAVLVIPLTEDAVNSEPLAQLICGRFSEGRNAVRIIDLPYFTDDYLVPFDGRYDSSKKQYRMRITRHIQGVLTGVYENTGLIIHSRDTYERVEAANRCIMDGSKIALEIYYTE